MNIGVDGLSVIFSIWSDYKSVVGVYISCLVNSVVARSDPPCWVSPLMTVIVRMVVVLLKVRPGRHGEVHEMCNGGLPLATIDGLHGGLVQESSAAVRGKFGSKGEQKKISHTDSAIASSSANRARRCALCCFRAGWLFLAVAV